MVHHTILRFITIAGVTLLLGCAPMAINSDSPDTAADSSSKAERPAPATVVDMLIFFKLDPALTRGLSMGDRWVSPARFENVVQEGTVGTVVVKVRGVNSMRQAVAVSPEWLPADPDMVTVTTNADLSQTINVHRAGTSELLLKHGNVSKRLSIISTYSPDINGTQVAIAKGTHD